MRLFSRSFRFSVVFVTAFATLLAAAGLGFTHYEINRQRSSNT